MTLRKLLAISIVLIIGTAAFLPSCADVPSKSPFMRDDEEIDFTTYELRNHLISFVSFYSTRIEQAADQILEQADDSAVREHAYLWKIYAIPLGQRVAFNVDPMVGLADLWAFCMQMRLYFSEGEGREIFGEYQHIAIDITAELERAAAEIISEVYTSGDIREHKKTVLEWVEAYPIEDRYYSRASISDTLVSLAGFESADIGTAMGGLAINLHNVREEPMFHFDLLPRQVMWQSEYLMDRMADEGLLRQSEESLKSLTESTERITLVVEQTPEILEEARASTLEDINGQRIETIEALRIERIAMLEAMTMEREAIFDELDRMRARTIHDLDSLVLRTKDESAQLINDSIDHLFWRMVQLLLIAGAITGVIVFVVLKNR